MEAVAFDLMPAIADVQVGGIYGSTLLAVIWVMVIILVSYATWESTIRVHERGDQASRALIIACGAFWLFNLGAMVFEFILFRMIVDELIDLGFPIAPELFGTLMVAAHQAASFWIMKNVVGQFFHLRRRSKENEDV